MKFYIYTHIHRYAEPVSIVGARTFCVVHVCERSRRRSPLIFPVVVIIGSERSSALIINLHTYSYVVSAASNMLPPGQTWPFCLLGPAKSLADQDRLYDMMMTPDTIYLFIYYY